ncbi:MAG: chitobiase/beta-hexosaminidase C-terminal domain-containing protein, partial [Bryobacteraceae bacterium]
MRTAPRFARGGKTTVRLALWFCACNLMAAVLAAQCSNPTQVPNQTISSGTANYSDNNALAASSVVINGSASVTFLADNCIDLQPGFHATAGTAATTFHAWIGASVPSITSLSVTSGTVGTPVTITGNNFGSSQSSSTVKFNGTTASVTYWGATSVGVTVPAGATSGNVVVTVNGQASNGVSFSVTMPVATLTFSPAAGTYTSVQSVTLSTTTGGATIRYTTDGSTPSETVGTVYSGPVAVNGSETLQAMAYKSLWLDSAVATAVYTLNLPPPPAVTLTAPSNGALNQPTALTLAWAAAAGATSYDVYLGAGTPTWAGNTTNTSYTPGAALAGGTTYAWYVIANNASGSGPASPTWTFTTLAASLTIASAHTGTFTQGQSNATYTLTVANGASAGATADPVAVTETVPSGLIPVGMQGAGWTCAGPTCVRSDALAPGASYPAIALTVDVANHAPASVTNAATVSGGGSANASASDPTTIDALPVYSIPLAFAVPASVVAGVPTTFTVTYASQAGSGDIAGGQVQIDACYLGWDSSGNITLYYNPNQAYVSGMLGQNATLWAGSCSINLANSTLSPVPGNPYQLALSLAITFPEQNWQSTDFFGAHEVYAWGTNAEGLATAAVDLGAMVVSPGQDYTLTVSPSGSTTVPYMGTVTLTVTATGLNGFTGLVNLQIGLAPGWTNPCFSLWGSIPYLTANSQGSFTLQNTCQYGSWWTEFVITGNAPSIGVNRTGSSNPMLNATAGADFTITPGLPTPPNLPAQGSIQYPVTVTSIGNQSGYVNLTLAPPAGGSMPAGVTYQFAPAQVYLSGGGTAQSTLTLSSAASTPGGA